MKEHENLNASDTLMLSEGFRSKLAVVTYHLESLQLPIRISRGRTRRLELDSCTTKQETNEPATPPVPQNIEHSK